IDILLAFDNGHRAVATLGGPEERTGDGEHPPDLLDLLDVAIGRQVRKAGRLVVPIQAGSRAAPFLDGRRHTLTPSLTHQTLLPFSPSTKRRQPPARHKVQPRPQAQRPRGTTIGGLAPRPEVPPELGDLPLALLAMR